MFRDLSSLYTEFGRSKVYDGDGIMIQYVTGIDFDTGEVETIATNYDGTYLVAHDGKSVERKKTYHKLPIKVASIDNVSGS